MRTRCLKLIACSIGLIVWPFCSGTPLSYADPHPAEMSTTLSAARQTGTAKPTPAAKPTPTERKTPAAPTGAPQFTASAAEAQIVPVYADKRSKPVKKDRKYYEARGDIVWEVKTDEKMIALTFDDGPNPRITPLILDLLKQYDAKATFFTLGSRVQQFPELARRVVAEGHELSNHTYNHLYFRSGLDEARYLDDILKAQQVIRQTTGQLPRLFRPPGGYYNDAVVHAAKLAGINQVVIWSWHQDTKDWRNPGVDKIVSKVLNNARNGDIVLMHDHAERTSQTVEALKTILPELKQRGFRMVTVSELLSYGKPVHR